MKRWTMSSDLSDDSEVRIRNMSSTEGVEIRRIRKGDIIEAKDQPEIKQSQTWLMLNNDEWVLAQDGETQILAPWEETCIKKCYKMSLSLPPDARINLRQAPNLDSKVVGTVSSSCILGALDFCDDWIQVRSSEATESVAWCLTKSEEVLLLQVIAYRPQHPGCQGTRAFELEHSVA